MWAELITVILGLIALGVGFTIWIIINKREMKLDIKPNSSFFLNIARPDFTNGYVLGIIKKQTKCKNGCTRISFYPVDRKEGEGTKRPPVQHVIYKDANLKRISPGDWSGEREIVVGVTNNMTEIPKGLLDSSFGNYLEKESLYSFLVNKFGKRLQETLKATADFITQDTSLGLTTQQIARINEISKEKEKILMSSILQKIQEGTPEKK